MDEYVATVLIEGNNKPTELKNFGVTPEEVIDNIVQLPNVAYLYHIKRLKDDAVWDFDAELEPLREIRKMISRTDGGIGLELRITETEEEDDTQLH